mgnify:CR=1 FL=1
MSKLFNDDFIKQVEGMSRTKKNMEIKCFYEGIYDFYKSELGEKHPTTLIALNNLADFYKDMREFHKALELYEEVYAKRKEVLGEKHPDTLTALADLADSYSYLGEHKKAYKLQYIVYATRIEILGEKHPDTLMALGNLINTSIIIDETNEH